MGGINSLSGLNKVNVDFRPAIETNVTKTDDANRPQPATDSLPDEAQPPAKTDIGRIVRQLDVLLLNAAGNSVSADGVKRMDAMGKALVQLGVIEKRTRTGSSTSPRTPRPSSRRSTSSPAGRLPRR